MRPESAEKPREQTYVFKTKIGQGIQKWVQNNQLLTLPSTNFFKKLFSAPKIVKKIGKNASFLIPLRTIFFV